MTRMLILLRLQTKFSSLLCIYDNLKALPWGSWEEPWSITASYCINEWRHSRVKLFLKEHTNIPIQFSASRSWVLNQTLMFDKLWFLIDWGFHFQKQSYKAQPSLTNRMKKNQTWRPSTSLKLHAWFALLPGTTKGGGTRWHVWTVFLADMFTLQWYGGHILSEQFGTLFCSWLPDLSLIINSQFSWFKKLSGRTIIFSLFNISTICQATVG